MINDPRPSKIAAKSDFSYDRRNDNFTWKLTLDDGTSHEVEAGIPSSSLEQLYQALEVAISERNTVIRRTRRDSVSMPSKFMGRTR